VRPTDGGSAEDDGAAASADGGAPLAVGTSVAAGGVDAVSLVAVLAARVLSAPPHAVKRDATSAEPTNRTTCDMDGLIAVS
jgi:hypothetical protein